MASLSSNYIAPNTCCMSLPVQAILAAFAPFSEPLLDALAAMGVATVGVLGTYLNGPLCEQFTYAVHAKVTSGTYGKVSIGRASQVWQFCHAARDWFESGEDSLPAAPDINPEISIWLNVSFGLNKYVADKVQAGLSQIGYHNSWDFMAWPVDMAPLDVDIGSHRFLLQSIYDEVRRRHAKVCHDPAIKLHTEKRRKLGSGPPLAVKPSGQTGARSSGSGADWLKVLSEKSKAKSTEKTPEVEEPKHQVIISVGAPGNLMFHLQNESVMAQFVEATGWQLESFADGRYTFSYSEEYRVRAEEEALGNISAKSQTFGVKYQFAQVCMSRVLKALRGTNDVEELPETNGPRAEGSKGPKDREDDEEILASLGLSDHGDSAKIVAAREKDLAATAAHFDELIAETNNALAANELPIKLKAKVAETVGELKAEKKKALKEAGEDWARRSLKYETKSSRLYKIAGAEAAAAGSKFNKAELVFGVLNARQSGTGLPRNNNGLPAAGSSAPTALDLVSPNTSQDSAAAMTDDDFFDDDDEAALDEEVAEDERRLFAPSATAAGAEVPAAEGAEEGGALTHASAAESIEALLL